MSKHNETLFYIIIGLLFVNLVIKSWSFKNKVSKDNYQTSGPQGFTCDPSQCKNGYTISTSVSCSTDGEPSSGYICN